MLKRCRSSLGQARHRPHVLTRTRRHPDAYMMPAVSLSLPGTQLGGSCFLPLTTFCFFSTRSSLECTHRSSFFSLFYFFYIPPRDARGIPAAPSSRLPSFRFFSHYVSLTSMSKHSRSGRVASPVFAASCFSLLYSLVL